MPLTVWYATGYGRVSNSHQFDMLVAARSRAAAARAMGVTASWLAKYGSRTGNAADCAVATADPGALFYRTAGSYGAWTRAR